MISEDGKRNSLKFSVFTPRACCFTCLCAEQVILYIQLSYLYFLLFILNYYNYVRNWYNHVHNHYNHVHN